MFVVMAPDCDADGKSAGSNVCRCGDPKASTCYQGKDLRVQCEDSIRQPLVKDAFVEVFLPESVGSRVWGLALDAIEIVVGDDPAEADENEFAVARREAENLNCGWSAHADTPLAQVGGTELCWKVLLASCALSELSCSTCITAR